MNKRLKELRKSLGLTQQVFADRLGIPRGSIASYEVGKNAIGNAVISLICREFGANEKWLRTGEGEMFLPPEDEVADLVSNLLEEENPFYDLILDIMHIYDELDEKSKLVFQETAKALTERMAQKKKED